VETASEQSSQTGDDYPTPATEAKAEEPGRGCCTWSAKVTRTSPTAACHFVVRAQGQPVLTLIFNNALWEPVKSSTLGLIPLAAVRDGRQGDGQCDVPSRAVDLRLPSPIKSTHRSRRCAHRPHGRC
jgi:hypothetical protein